MNSIDGVLARIQEILNRIQEIQATQGRVQGMAPAASPPVTGTHQSGAKTASESSVSPAPTGANDQRFRQLLQEALAAGSGGLSAASSTGTAGAGLLSGSLGGLSGLSNLDSILSGSSGNASSSNSGALSQYQQELVQALQELAAQKQKNIPQ